MKRILLAVAILALVSPALRQAEAADVSIDFFYDNLGSGGSWVELDDYGYAWQPTVAVSNSSWRPYSDGYWAYTDVGWTWVSYEDFGWATYHYGRWTRLRGRGWFWVPGREWGPAWVSWRTGGDYVGWAPLPARRLSDEIYEGRPITGQVDVEFDIGPLYYNFVDVRYIGEPVLRERIYAPEQNITYITRTVNVTNITYRNSVVYNYGPDYNVVSRYSTRQIPRLSIQRDANYATAPAGGRTRVQGDRLFVSAPPVLQKTTTPVAPKAIKEKIAKPEVERGWSGDPKAQAELKEKMKKEDPKAAPTPSFTPNSAQSPPSPAQGANETPAAGASPAASPAASISPAASVPPGRSPVASPETGKGKGKGKRGHDAEPTGKPAPSVAPGSPPAASVAPEMSPAGSPQKGKGKEKGKRGQNALPAASPAASAIPGASPAAPDVATPATPPEKGKGKGKSKREEKADIASPAPAAPPATAPASGNETSAPSVAPEKPVRGKDKGKRQGKPPASVPPTGASDSVAPPSQSTTTASAAPQPSAPAEKARGKHKAERSEVKPAAQPPAAAQPSAPEVQARPHQPPAALPERVAPPSGPAANPAAKPDQGRGKPEGKPEGKKKKGEPEASPGQG